MFYLLYDIANKYGVLNMKCENLTRFYRRESWNQSFTKYCGWIVTIILCGFVFCGYSQKRTKKNFILCGIKANKTYWWVGYSL